MFRRAHHLPCQGHFSSVYMIISYFSNLYFNIVPAMLISSKMLLPLRFPKQIFIHISYYPYMLLLVPRNFSRA
jgi:hypothetical protein